ncbi:MAG: dephospho-CoA kinase [Muribaculaceae bacterium]|nr:dephospho-CoA kinase [Muribaculaceae bacterium]
MKIRVTGIAGGLGSGKSMVSRILRLQGHDVYDCDHEARLLMEDAGHGVRAVLIERFGTDIFPGGGGLDRGRLAGLMFSDAEILAWVNATVHGAVREDVRAWIGDAASHGVKRVWIESAILAGSGLTEVCDDVWLVTAPEEVRLDRAEGRGMSRTDAARRIASQREETRLLMDAGLPVAEIANGPDDTLLDRLAQLTR